MLRWDQHLMAAIEGRDTNIARLPELLGKGERLQS
jgi:hypothetical protein